MVNRIFKAIFASLITCLMFGLFLMVKPERFQAVVVIFILLHIVIIEGIFTRTKYVNYYNSFEMQNKKSKLVSVFWALSISVIVLALLCLAAGYGESNFCIFVFLFILLPTLLFSAAISGCMNIYSYIKKEHCSKCVAFFILVITLIEVILFYELCLWLGVGLSGLAIVGMRV